MQPAVAPSINQSHITSPNKASMPTKDTIHPTHEQVETIARVIDKLQQSRATNPEALIKPRVRGRSQRTERPESIEKRLASLES
jgi:hypothetical protein